MLSLKSIKYPIAVAVAGRDFAPIACESVGAGADECATGRLVFGEFQRLAFGGATVAAVEAVERRTVFALFAGEAVGAQTLDAAGGRLDARAAVLAPVLAPFDARLAKLARKFGRTAAL